MNDPREVRLTTPQSSVTEKSCFCQACGAQAPTKRVEFWRLIGAVIMFQFKSSGGFFCKACIHRHFWDYTMVTLCFGWWGLLSFVLTPFVLLHNIIRYVFCLWMPAAPKVEATRTAPPATPKPKEREQTPEAKRMEIIWDLPGDSASKADGR